VLENAKGRSPRVRVDLVAFSQMRLKDA